MNGKIGGINFDAVAALLSLRRGPDPIGHRTFTVGMALATFMKAGAGSDGVCWPGRARIAERCGVGESHVSTELGVLQRREFIVRDKKRGRFRLHLSRIGTAEVLERDNRVPKRDSKVPKPDAEVPERDALIELTSEQTREPSKERETATADKRDPWDFSGKLPEWKEAYPGIDVELEIKKCRSWWNANPRKVRGRAGGPLRTVVNWLGRSQAERETRAGAQKRDVRGGEDYALYD